MGYGPQDPRVAEVGQSGQLASNLDDRRRQRFARGLRRSEAELKLKIGREDLKAKMAGNHHQVDCKLQFHPAAAEAKMGA